MKKVLPLLILSILLLSSCGESSGPPNETGNPYIDDTVVISGDMTDEDFDVEGDTAGGVGDDGGGETADLTGAETDLTNTETDMDIFAYREKNVDLAMENEKLQKEIEKLREDLASTTASVAESEELQMLKDYLPLVKDAIINSEQREYSFSECGMIGSFLRAGWYKSFTDTLNQSQIRFSNGYLEAGDLLGGCFSSEGKMAFFLGAERNSDSQFMLLKYETDSQKLTQAYMFDDAGTATVTGYGKRTGAYIPLKSDDGRELRYYYDKNIVIEE